MNCKYFKKFQWNKASLSYHTWFQTKCCIDDSARFCNLDSTSCLFLLKSGKKRCFCNLKSAALVKKKNFHRGENPSKNRFQNGCVCKRSMHHSNENKRILLRGSSQSVVRNSGQKMALRAFYFINVDIYCSGRCQRILLAAIERTTQGWRWGKRSQCKCWNCRVFSITV